MVRLGARVRAVASRSSGSGKGDVGRWVVFGEEALEADAVVAHFDD
jgi:hypothetical protein